MALVERSHQSTDDPPLVKTVEMTEEEKSNGTDER